MLKKLSLIGTGVCLFLTSCAHYDASSLCSISPQTISKTPSHDGLIVAAKAFSKADCKRYLDRDVLSKGFQPIQLYIENLTDKTLLFSTSRVQLPLTPPDEVAKKVHSSTVGRIAGYSAVAVFAAPIFLIPAVVDGIKSSKANDSLDQDFAEKSAKDQQILPYSHANMLLFVPIKSAPESFVVTLLDEKNNRPIRIVVKLH